MAIYDTLLSFLLKKYLVKYSIPILHLCLKKCAFRLLDVTRHDLGGCIASIKQF